MKKVLLSLNQNDFELLDKESKRLGMNKSQFMRRLINDNVENRLSKHIVRDIENLLLFLILQNNLQIKEIDKTNLVEKLDEIYEQTKNIKTSKMILLKEQKNKRKNEMKKFWNKVLKLLEPQNFMNEVSINGKFDGEKTKKFVLKLRNIIKENIDIWKK